MSEGPGIWTPGGEYRPRQEPEAPEGPQDLSPDEVAELMRQLRIADFLLSNVSTLAQLAYAKLDRTSRDLEQARLAIDALRALLPVLEGAIPAELSRDYGQVVSNLQLAFAHAADEQGAEPDEPS